MIQIDTSNARSFLPDNWLTSRLDALESARQKLETGNGAGGDFTGWVHLPRDYDKEEFARIQAAAERIRANSQALVVIGIGGSYLGARAVVELVNSQLQPDPQGRSRHLLRRQRPVHRRHAGSDGAYQG